MCSSEIVHSGRQHRGPTWGKRLYCDSYLTRRPARCAGATASFNFTQLLGQPKSALGCLCEGRKSEQRERRHARDLEWEGKWSSSVAKLNCEEISQPVFLTTVRRGILSGGCSHFLIPSEYILSLTSKPHRWLPKTAHIFSRDGRAGGGGQCHTGTTASLWLRELMRPPALHEWQFEWPASACKENPGSPSRMGKHPQGGEEQAGMAGVWHHPSVGFHVSVKSPVCVNKELVLPPLSLPLPHIHYSDFLLLLLLHQHHHNAQTLQLQRRVEAGKMGSEGKGGCFGHALPSKPENQEAAATY